VQLKCPADSEANGFYEHLGFSRVDVQQGKNRNLVIWQLPIDSSMLQEDENRVRVNIFVQRNSASSPIKKSRLLLDN